MVTKFTEQFDGAIKSYSKTEVVAALRAGVESWNEFRSNADRSIVFRGGEFTEAGMESVSNLDLSSCNLIEFNFEGFDLSEVNFRGSTLRSANFSGCNLEFCDFYRANLFKANFFSSELEHCRFRRANLTGSSFARVRCEYSNFALANLTEVDASRAEFDGCDFSEAKLVRTSLSYTDLPHSNFWHAEFYEADVFSARFAQAVDLSQDQVDLSNGDEDTTLPKTLLMPEIWSSDRSYDVRQFGRIVDFQKDKVYEFYIEDGELKRREIPPVVEEGLRNDLLITLSRELDKVNNRGSLHNYFPELGSALINYGKSIENGRENGILVCIEGQLLRSIFRRARSEIIEVDREICGLLEGVLELHSKFEAGVEQWESVNSDIQDLDETESVFEDLSKINSDVLNVITDSRSNVDSEIIDDMNSLELSLESEKRGSAKYSSALIKDIMIAPFKYLMEFGEKTSEKFLEEGSKELALTLARSFKYILAGSCAYIATRYPSIFGPIQKLIDMASSLLS